MTLVLLSVLIAMVTQVIGNDVARAFTPGRHLAIVRFRTVVRDTRDTAYAADLCTAGGAYCSAAVGVCDALSGARRAPRAFLAQNFRWIDGESS
jgi:hypothetical protein